MPSRLRAARRPSHGGIAPQRGQQCPCPLASSWPGPTLLITPANTPPAARQGWPGGNRRCFWGGRNARRALRTWHRPQPPRLPQDLGYSVTFNLSRLEAAPRLPKHGLQLIFGCLGGRVSPGGVGREGEDGRSCGVEFQTSNSWEEQEKPKSPSGPRAQGIRTFPSPKCFPQRCRAGKGCLPPHSRAKNGSFFPKPQEFYREGEVEFLTQSQRSSCP